MGWLVALLSLLFTLITGVVLALIGAVLSAWVLQTAAMRWHDESLPFKRLWRVSCLALVCGFVIGKGVELLLGGPSLLTPLFAVPLYTCLYTLLLRWRMPVPFAAPGWHWRTPGLTLLATLAGGIAMAAFVALIGGVLRGAGG